MNKTNLKPGYYLLIWLLVTAGGSSAQYWQPAPGQIPGVSFTGIASDIQSSSIVVVTHHNGIYRSTNAGNSWSQVFATADSIFTLINIDGRHMCAGGKGFSYTTADSGVSWASHALPFPVAINKMAVHPSGALIAATGSEWDVSGLMEGRGVWLSPDSGRTWTAINNGITKPNALIEALAIAPQGTVYAGIFDTNVGLNGKYGVMKLDSLNGSWERVNISVQAPFGQTYDDQNLRIESVFNLNILDGWLITSIEGVYINFGYAFTIQKEILDIDNASISWYVKWVQDSIPSTNSFYEHITNLFKDTHDTIWASVSTAASEINNDIYTGDLAASVPWHLNLDSITQQVGRFIFSEAANGQLFAISYFTGNKIFVRGLTATSIRENNSSSSWKIFPDPATSVVRLFNSQPLWQGSLQLILYNSTGVLVKEQTATSNGEAGISMDVKFLPAGLYFLSVSNAREHQMLRFIKSD